MALMVFSPSCEMLLLDRNAIEADICTVLVYQCRVKEKKKQLTKKPKARWISQKNLVVFTHTKLLGIN